MLCVSALIGLMTGCPTEGSDGGGGGGGSSGFSGNQTGLTIGTNGFLGLTHNRSGVQVHELNANGSIVPLHSGYSYSFYNYANANDVNYTKALSTLGAGLVTASVTGGKLSLSLGTPTGGTARADNYFAGTSEFTGANYSSPSTQVVEIAFFISNAYFFDAGIRKDIAIAIYKLDANAFAGLSLIWAAGPLTITKPSNPQINITLTQGWNTVVYQFPNLLASIPSSITSAGSLDGFGWLTVAVTAE